MGDIVDEMMVEGGEEPGEDDKRGYVDRIGGVGDAATGASTGKVEASSV